jgi:hypothetical protein
VGYQYFHGDSEFYGTGPCIQISLFVVYYLTTNGQTVHHQVSLQDRKPKEKLAKWDFVEGYPVKASSALLLTPFIQDEISSFSKFCKAGQVTNGK